MTTTYYGSGIQADGIRDLVLNHGGNGSTASVPMNSQKLYEREPVRNGSKAVTTNTTTTAHQWNDFRGMIKSKASGGAAQWTSGSGKASITNSLSGWFTTGGCSCMSLGNASIQRGACYDGTSTFTNTSIAFSNIAPNGNSNKNWCGWATLSSSGFGVGFSLVMAFEGSGSSTSDTDWTSFIYSVDIENDYSSGGFYTSAYMSSVLVFEAFRNLAGVSEQGGRERYVWANQIGPLQNNTTTADFMYWIKFT